MPTNTAINYFNNLEPENKVDYCFNSIKKELGDFTIIYDDAIIRDLENFKKLAVVIDIDYEYCYLSKDGISFVDICLREFNNKGFVIKSENENYTVDQGKISFMNECDGINNLNLSNEIY